MKNLKAVKKFFCMLVCLIFTFVLIIPAKAEKLEPNDERADLEITKVSVENITPGHETYDYNPYMGDHLKVTIIATNKGPKAAKNAFFEAVFNGGYQLVYAKDITNLNNIIEKKQDENRILKWDYTEDFDNQATKTYEFEVVVKPDQGKNGQYDFHAVIDSATFDGYPSDDEKGSFKNNVFDSSNNSQMNVQEAIDLAVDKTSNFDNKEAKINDLIEVNLRVTNQSRESGLSEAKNAVVVDKIPDGYDMENLTVQTLSNVTSEINKTNRTITWIIASIKNGESVDLKYSSKLIDDVYNTNKDSYTNNVEVIADKSQKDLNNDNNKDSNKLNVKINPSIKIEKKADKTNYDLENNKTVKYTFIITNTGDVVIHNVVLNDKLLGITNKAVKAALKPGETITVEETLQLSDIYVGGFINTAQVKGYVLPGDKSKAYFQETNSSVEAFDSVFIDVAHKTLTWVGDNGLLSAVYGGIILVGTSIGIILFRRRKSSRNIS